MKHKMVLTSMLAIMVAGPALAEDFPTDGYMKENKTYDDAATYTNTGVYSGEVTATAVYADVLYQIAAGKYLAQSTTTETTCPVGSYCGGLVDAIYDADNDQGITSCPTIDSVSYTSAAGSSLITECYTESEKACSDVNTQATVGVGHVASITYANTSATGTQYAVNSTTAGDWAMNTAGACDITTMTCDNGYHYKAASTNPLSNENPMIGGAAHRYKSNNGTGSNSADTTGLDNGTYDVTLSNGTVKGNSLCSTTSTGTPDTNNGGQYCWCNINGYTPTLGTLQTLSGNWVFNADLTTTADCTSGCAESCAYNLYSRGGIGFRLAMFDSIVLSAPSCEANTITINWEDAANVSEATSSTVYDGDIVTPTAAKAKTGKTFKGWIFNKTSN